MKTVRVKIDPKNSATLPVGRVDYQVLDSTTESQLAEQKKFDDAEVMQDSAKFARRVRKRLVTCPDIFEPVGFRDTGSSHLRSSDETSEIYGRADRSNIARGG